MNLIITTIPRKANPVKKPDPSDVLEYDKYLVDAAACAECHTQQEKGQKVKEMDFAGRFGFSLQNGFVLLANFTPRETGLLNYSKQAFVNRFKIYADSFYVDPMVEENGFQTVMPWK
ncbi:MAG: cytochrome C, partial [Opitutaceae bacterium]|nr:cytochrome C [Cytophagales bacterium]